MIDPSCQMVRRHDRSVKVWMQTFLIGRANLTDVSFVWDAKAFGERIRSARGARKAEAVADGAAIAPETLSRYENGKMPNISVFVAKRIAGALNTTVAVIHALVRFPARSWMSRAAESGVSPICSRSHSASM